MEFMLVGIEFGLSLIILIIQGILFSLAKTFPMEKLETWFIRIWHKIRCRREWNSSKNFY